MSRVLLLLAAVATVVTGLALVAAGVARQPAAGPALTARLIPALGLVWAAITVAQGLTARRTRRTTTK